MKCPYCGKEFSPKVFAIHVKRCPENKPKPKKRAKKAVENDNV